MVPARNTINEIFSIVENIVPPPPKNRKAEWITAYLTAHDKCKLWIPAGCLLCSLIAGSLYIGGVKNEWLELITYLGVILAPVTYVIVVFIFAIRNLKPSDFLTSITEEIRKRAHTDASHVDELSQYKWQDLQYVLVEIKAEREASEKQNGAFLRWSRAWHYCFSCGPCTFP